MPNAADVVLALARGGIPVGFAVADRLHIPLEVIVVRKLGVPAQPELAMGAIAGGTTILDNRMIRQLGISEQDIEDTIAREHAEMRRREDLYRTGKPPLDLRGKSVILVDDGLATGSTMLAAVRYVRDFKPARMIIGVPVGSRQACARLLLEVDDLVCLATPENFLAVGRCYRDFEQVSDDDAQGVTR
jgi:putative phosphoribosyl transferase